MKERWRETDRKKMTRVMERIREADIGVKEVRAGVD